MGTVPLISSPVSSKETTSPGRPTMRNAQIPSSSALLAAGAAWRGGVNTTTSHLRGLDVAYAPVSTLIKSSALSVGSIDDDFCTKDLGPQPAARHANSKDRQVRRILFPERYGCGAGFPSPPAGGWAFGSVFNCVSASTADSAGLGCSARLHNRGWLVRLDGQ